MDGVGSSSKLAPLLGARQSVAASGGELCWPSADLWAEGSVSAEQRRVAQLAPIRRCQCCGLTHSRRRRATTRAEPQRSVPRPLPPLSLLM